ncbi:MAG: hypothetical protein KA515_00845 [Candidatus Pacebacteria bacterium]|nr:hypothetical protein [Candidatus Paceibacterota bacterium]
MRLNVVNDALRTAVRQTGEFLGGLPDPETVVVMVSTEGGFLLKAASFPELYVSKETFAPFGQLEKLLCVFMVEVGQESLIFVLEEGVSPSDPRECSWGLFTTIFQTPLSRLVPRVRFVPAG